MFVELVPRCSNLFLSLGASSKVEKENTHYQGLPEDVGPDSGRSWIFEIVSTPTENDVRILPADDRRWVMTGHVLAPISFDLGAGELEGYGHAFSARLCALL